jgi:4-diphosphocytidyl-2C-methyl-D-erythritol kinase
VLTRSEAGHRLESLLEELEDFPNSALVTYNSFQAAVIDRYTEVGGILENLSRTGAVLTSLSGSGSACFALFGERDEAIRTKDLMLKDGHAAWMVRPVNRAIEFLMEK